MGMSRETGREIAGIDHIRQSIGDILTTPLGARAGGMVTDAHGRARHVRDYGTDLLALIDKPITPALRVAAVAAAAQAIDAWEPRFRVTAIRVAAAAPGRIGIALDGIDLIAGKPARLDGIEIGGTAR